MNARRMTPAEVALTSLESALSGMWQAKGIERTILRAMVRWRLDEYRVQLALEDASWKSAVEQHLMRHGIGFLEARS